MSKYTEDFTVKEKKSEKYLCKMSKSFIMRGAQFKMLSCQHFNLVKRETISQTQHEPPPTNI